MKNISFLNYKNIFSFSLVCLLIAFLISLSIYGLKGTYSRYAQDDYCYGYRVRNSSFLAMQVDSYFGFTEFNSNRYSSTLSHTVVESLGGPYFFPVLPIILLLTWALSIGYGLYSIFATTQPGVFSPPPEQFRIFNVSITLKTFAILSTGALGVLFYTLYLTKNLYEVLFWLAGSQSYLMPTILYTYIVARMIHFFRLKEIKKRRFIGNSRGEIRIGGYEGGFAALIPPNAEPPTATPREPKRYIFEIALLSLWAGGFSETTTLWFFSGLSIYFISVLIIEKRSGTTKVRKTLLITALAATAAALIILALAPKNFRVMETNFVQPDFINFIQSIFTFGFSFILLTIRGAPLPSFVLILFGGWLGFHMAPAVPLSLKKLSLIFIFGSVCLYLLTVTVMVPTMFTMSSSPGDRALLPARFSLILYLFGMGLLGGQWLQSRLRQSDKFNLFAPAVILVGFFLIAYSTRAIPNVFEKFELYRARAEAWDQRHAMILLDKAAGIVDVKVPAFDSVYGITEIKDNPGHWVNGCASKYYGVNSISAIENYSGIGTVPIGK